MAATAVLTKPCQDWGIRDQSGEIVAVCDEATAWLVAFERKDLDIVTLLPSDGGHERD